jgi:hypothetical protein
MKAEFLKLAGVKTEKAFYKKYPTEAAFFKAHPEAKKMIKKAQIGVDLDGNGIDDNQDRINKIKQLANPFNPSAIAPSIIGQKPPIDLNAPTNNSTGFGFKQPSIPMADYNSQGSNIVTISDEELKNPKSGMTNPELLPKKKGDGEDFWTKASPYAGYIGQFIGGIRNLKADTIKTKYKEQWADVSDPVAKAAGLRPEQRERRYVRPEDNILQPDQMFPSYGVGTNVLAKNGAEIQNTYAPGYLYDDLGYEPLDESNQVKQYFYGGGIPKAEGGFSTFMTSGGGDMLTGLAGYATGNNPGGQIGGAIGGAAGTAFGGPVGGMIGQSIGTLAGGLLDGNARRQKRNQPRKNRGIFCVGELPSYQQQIIDGIHHHLRIRTN